MALTGVITALVTPFKADESIDFKAMGQLLELQYGEGVSGVTANGSTGEFYAMSAEERASVLKFVAENSPKSATLVAGNNGGSTREVIEHTRTARSLGYRHMLLAPPYYSMPTQTELTEHIKAILDAVKDVNLILYNFPFRTGVPIGWETLDALHEHPRIVAIKESSGDLHRILEIKRRYGDSIDILNGSDDIPYDAYVWGASGWLCGPANCFARETVAIDRAFRAGKHAEAQELARKLYPAMLNLESGLFVQKVKYGCELLGVPVGNPRRPLLPLEKAKKAEFAAVFKAVTGNGKAAAAKKKAA
jgi:4-hydroxy-tetrahydrodipicolinate synthase